MKVITNPKLRETDSLSEIPAFKSEEAVRNFVQQAYHDLFNRAPSDEEFTRSFEDLWMGDSPEYFVQQLLLTEEKQTQIIQRYYQKFLDRNASQDGLQFWFRLRASGKKNEEILATLLTSHEFLLRHGYQHEDYIRGLYQDVFLRNPSDTEINSWIGLLNAHAATKHCVAMQFVTDKEFRNLTIRRWFLQYLKREPSTQNLEDWSDLLGQGLAQEEVLAKLLCSEQYLTRARKK